MAKKAKVKVKGVVLMEAFLALLLMTMASYGLASVNSVQFSQMAAGRESDSAKNYAELEAEYLKSLGYDAVVTNNKDEDDPSRTPRYPDGEQSSVDKASNARDMTKFLGDTLGSEWRSTATLGKTINNINGDSDKKIQNIVVSVYKKSDGNNASPRATVTLPLSSQSSGGGIELDYSKEVVRFLYSYQSTSAPFNGVLCIFDGQATGMGQAIGVGGNRVYKPGVDSKMIIVNKGDTFGTGWIGSGGGNHYIYVFIPFK